MIIVSIISIGIFVIITGLLKPQIIFFLYLFVLMAFNDYLGTFPKSVIRIGDHLFYGADFFIALLVIAIISNSINKEKINKIDSSVFILIIIFIIYGIIEGITGISKAYLTNNVIGDFRRYFYYLLSIFVPMVIIRNKKEISSIEKVAMSAALIICIFAFIRIITGQSYVPRVHGEGFGNFRSMNFHDYIILIFVLCLSLGKIAYEKTKKNYMAKVYVIILPIFILSSNYRIAWLLLFLCPSIVIFVFKNTNIKMSFLKRTGIVYLIVLTIGAVSLTSTGSFGSLGIGKRIYESIIDKSLDSSFRKKMWEEALFEWKSSPLVGTGLGKELFFIERAETVTGLVNKVDGFSNTTLHNSYVELLLKTGILGLLIYISLILRVFKDIFICFKNSNQKPFIAAGIAFIIAVLIQSFVQPFLSDPNSIVLIYMIVGSLICLKKSSISLGTPPRTYEHKSVDGVYS